MPTPTPAEILAAAKAYERAEMPETERKLRRLLAVQFAGSALYTDDGELSDGRAHPIIDFLRYTPDQILQCIRRRRASAKVDEHGVTPDWWRNEELRWALLHLDSQTGASFMEARLISQTLRALIKQASDAATRPSPHAFKEYVHQRLDAMGVPVDPESPHRAEGCRIGGRLDFVEQQLAARAEGAEPEIAVRHVQHSPTCEHSLAWRRLCTCGASANAVHEIVVVAPPRPAKVLPIPLGSWNLRGSWFPNPRLEMTAEEQDASNKFNGFGFGLRRRRIEDAAGGSMAPQESDDKPWVRDDQRTQWCMLLISEEGMGPAELERIATWSDAECEAVEDYCRAIHFKASDNDNVEIPPKPICLGAVWQAAVQA